jgi:hypothetical protein
VAKAETNIPWALCEAVARALTFHPDWMPLQDVVLQAIALVGGNRNRVLGLDVINQCLRGELLELALLAPNGVWTVFSKTDCEHRTVHAPLIPAEGVRVEPYEAGHYFVRRATSPASGPTVRTEESMPGPASPVEPVALDSPPADIESAPALPHPGGRPPAVDWEMVGREVWRLMNHHGEFSADDPDWNAQARLESALADFCETTFDKRPSETTIKDHIREPLRRWRQSRSET